MRRPFIVPCLVVVIAAAAAASPARGQSQADEAEGLIRQGIELRHQHQDARALPLFERAYKLARNPRTAAQLGLVKMALGYWVDAERLLSEGLASPDHPWIAQNRRTLEETRASARKNIGEIVVVGGPPGAEILVNGSLTGKLPLPEPIRLDKGTVEITLRAPGFTALSRSLEIAGGGHETLSMTLERAGAASPAPTTAASPASLPRSDPAAEPRPAPGLADAPGAAVTGGESAAGRDRSRTLRAAAWTAGPAALAGLALGIVETVVATNKTNAFNDHSVASPTAEDPNRRVPDCATDQLSDACRSIRDAREQAKTLAIVGYVAGGVLAVTSAVLFVLSSRRGPQEADSARSALSCAPVIGAPGMACRLTF